MKSVLLLAVVMVMFNISGKDSNERTKSSLIFPTAQNCSTNETVTFKCLIDVYTELTWQLNSTILTRSSPGYYTISDPMFYILCLPEFNNTKVACSNGTTSSEAATIRVQANPTQGTSPATATLPETRSTTEAVIQPSNTIRLAFLLMLLVIVMVPVPLMVAVVLCKVWRRDNGGDHKTLSELGILAQDAGEGIGVESSDNNINFSYENNFIYQNNSMVWKLEDHNFSMAFQAQSLPSGTNESLVEVSVTSGEDYVLPSLTVPVSMFFSINCRHKFYKNVLVSIEHFSAETSDLSFVISSNPQPPFQFELLSGGRFCKERHGKIERTEFCILAIVTRIRTGRWPRMLYYCALYTSLPVDYTWTVYIYITKDSATYKHRIKEDTNVSERTLNTYTLATVNHTTDYFIVDISLKDEEISHGWQLPLESINPIRIPRERIDGCYDVPTPANFKIIADCLKVRDSNNFVHGYKLADIDQENILSLVLSPQELPAKESEGSMIKNLHFVLDLEELLHHRSQLVTAFKFDLNWLAAQLLAIGILSSTNHEDISNIKSTLTPHDKADIMVSAIMGKLELDSKNLKRILDVLKKKPNFYKEAIALLEGANSIEALNERDGIRKRK